MPGNPLSFIRHRTAWRRKVDRPGRANHPWRDSSRESACRGRERTLSWHSGTETEGLRDHTGHCGWRRGESEERIAHRIRHRVEVMSNLCNEVTFSAKIRSEEHTSELQSRPHLVCRLLLEKKKESATY